MAEDRGMTESEMKESNSPKTDKKKPKGFISRMFTGIFRLHGDDFEKRLEYISKEEASIIARTRKRAGNLRIVSRYLIMFSVLFEVIAVGYAIMTTRSMDLDWKMRAVRVLPMFLLPVLSSLTYSVYKTFTGMRERRDQKTLERLRAERQAKIDELKERTNYYTTQQLIQRYDPDPAAKAAAATILASKMGADSGLKVYVGDESLPTGKSHDVEVVQAGELRNRKQLHTKSISAGNTPRHRFGEETPRSTASGSPTSSDHNQLVVNHYDPHGSNMHDGGWIARIAALLVGEDPTQSYALICGNCHMHNGLARQEDFPFITYYCPHCHALNCPKQQENCIFDSGSMNMSTLVEGDEQDPITNPTNLAEDSAVTTTTTISRVDSGSEIDESNEQQPSNDVAS